jgi:crotonobetainyl-CoA:carnitine CoA-transferase CaiB-like acyl-CoA transferase
VADLVDDPHLAATGFFSIESHPTEGRLRTMRTPTSWSASPPAAPRPAPRLGEHSAEVLREIGYSDADIARMAASGVIKKQD